MTSKVSCTRCGQYDGAHAAGCLFASGRTPSKKASEGATGEAAKVGKKVPDVTVNGRALTGVEVMTLHVALCLFLSDLESSVGTEETQGYKQCLQNIFRLMDL